MKKSKAGSDSGRRGLGGFIFYRRGVFPLLDRGDLGDAMGMSSTLKFLFQPDIHDLADLVQGCHLRGKTEDIGVVVATTASRGDLIEDQSSPNAGNLVCGNGHADS